MRGIRVLFVVAMWIVLMVSTSGYLPAQSRVIDVADPRAHVVGNEPDDVFGLVNNFPKFGPTVQETLRVKSGTTIKYRTGPQSPGKGCEGVWYPGAPPSAIGFQFILFDTADSLHPAGIDTSSQTWRNPGPDARRVNCKQNGQVMVAERYTGTQGQRFERRIETTTVVIQGTAAAPETTAKDIDPLNFVVEIDSLSP